MQSDFFFFKKKSFWLISSHLVALTERHIRCFVLPVDGSQAGPVNLEEADWRPRPLDTLPALPLRPAARRPAGSAPLLAADSVCS